MHIIDEPNLPTDLEPSQILVRTIVTGMSAGTELSVYSGIHGPGFYGWSQPYPTELGYLSVGRVAAVGDAVTTVQVGDVVFAQKRHRQEFLTSEHELFWKVPGSLDPDVAVFTYLINLAMHSLRRGGLIPGERVAIVGLGPIGLGGVAIAKTFGSPVAAIDPVAERRNLALELGADIAFDPTADDFYAAIADWAGEAGIDLVMETASTWPAIRTCSEIVRQEGRISVIALHPDKVEYNPIGALFYQKQLSIISTSFTPRDDYPPERERFTLRRNCQYILNGLASGAIRYEPAITHRIHYSELPGQYERLLAGDRTMGAVAVRWDES